jgi:hypothetical protein
LGRSVDIHQCQSSSYRRRERHVDLVGQLARRLAAIKDLQRRFDQEDRVHEQVVRSALRSGTEPPEETVTEPGTRYQLLEEAGELVWPLIVVLSEVVSEAITTLRLAEPALTTKLADELAKASELRREAERLRAEGRQREWQVDRRPGG